MLVGMVSERDLLRVLPGTVTQMETSAGARSKPKKFRQPNVRVPVDVLREDYHSRRHTHSLAVRTRRPGEQGLQHCSSHCMHSPPVCFQVVLAFPSKNLNSWTGLTLAT